MFRYFKCPISSRKLQSKLRAATLSEVKSYFHTCEIIPPSALTDISVLHVGLGPRQQSSHIDVRGRDKGRPPRHTVNLLLHHVCLTEIIIHGKKKKYQETNGRVLIQRQTTKSRPTCAVQWQRPVCVLKGDKSFHHTQGLNAFIEREHSPKHHPPPPTSL